MRVGYGRVSTRHQNPDGQALVAAGRHQVFVDKAYRLARDGDGCCGVGLRVR